MDKRFDFVIILFIFSSLLLFLSSYLMYKSLSQSLDFISNVIQCTGQVAEQPSSMELPNNSVNNLKWDI